MKKSSFSEAQIAFILRQAEEGTTVEEVCRKAGISIQTYYRWRKKYGGLMPSNRHVPAQEHTSTGVEATLPYANNRPTRVSRRRSASRSMKRAFKLKLRAICAPSTLPFTIRAVAQASAAMHVS